MALRSMPGQLVFNKMIYSRLPSATVNFIYFFIKYLVFQNNFNMYSMSNTSMTEIKLPLRH